jgi:hypothetical protein
VFDAAACNLLETRAWRKVLIAITLYVWESAPNVLLFLEKNRIILFISKK